MQEAIFACAEAMQATQNKQTNKILDMLKTIMQMMQGNLPASAPATNQQNNQNHNSRMKCLNCGMRHAKPEDCWELEANKSKRPANWKPAAEHIKEYNANKNSKKCKENGSSEQWQPGKVEINKKKHFPYLAAFGPTSPPIVASAARSIALSKLPTQVLCPLSKASWQWT